MLRILKVAILALVAAGCASGPPAGYTSQRLIADTMDQVCIPAAMRKLSPLVDFTLSKVSKQYGPAGPMRWRSLPWQTELQATQQGCAITYYGGFHNEIRADQLARLKDFKVLYTGANAAGAAIRDVLCADRPGGGLVGVIISTSQAKPDGRIPMVMISTVHDSGTCAAFAETSVIAVQRAATPPNE